MYGMFYCSMSSSVIFVSIVQSFTLYVCKIILSIQIFHGSQFPISSMVLCGTQCLVKYMLFKKLTFISHIRYSFICCIY